MTCALISSSCPHSHLNSLIPHVQQDLQAPPPHLSIDALTKRWASDNHILLYTQGLDMRYSAI
jgi:hypothetical protein